MLVLTSVRTALAAALVTGLVPSTLASLSGCSPAASLATANADAAPPAPWFYADFGEGIDWSSLSLAGADVAFRTAGGDLGSGPLLVGNTLSARLACGETTHLTVALRDGQPARAWTVPSEPCVEEAALLADWREVALGAAVVGDTTHAVLVLDVPSASLASVDR